MRFSCATLRSVTMRSRICMDVSWRNATQRMKNESVRGVGYRRTLVEGVPHRRFGASLAQYNKFSGRPTGDARESGAWCLWPRIYEQKKAKVSNGWIRYVKQTDILTLATHVNGWVSGMCPRAAMPVGYCARASLTQSRRPVSAAAVSRGRAVCLRSVRHRPGDVLSNAYVRSTVTGDRRGL